VLNNRENVERNGNGHKRKDLRKNVVLEFIKGHTDVSIKDILPNINGCSEKTIQRELVSLINEKKIKKIGERRWSRYSIV
jgi:predicted HTH transcriptional regulator